MDDRFEIDGEPATVRRLVPALVNYGHFTTMQVRGGAVRGLDVHLDRLDGANRELFGAPLDGGLVRGHIRHALAGVSDASVRVLVFQRPGTEAVSVGVSVRPPAEPRDRPLRLLSVGYQRPVAHLKHVGTFAQTHHGRLAERAGYDDALLTGTDGVISETTIANLGAVDGEGVVWPEAPALPGTTLRLLDRALAAAGTPSRRRVLRVPDLPSYRAVFVANSRGIVPVSGVDAVELPTDPAAVGELVALFEAVPWDAI